MQELEKTLLKETEQLVNMHYEDDSVKTIILRNLRDIRKHMSGKDTDVPTNDGWIPVEEQLPEEAGTYIINALTGERNIVTFAKWQNRYKRFDMTGARTYWKIIAWCPLPEPYRLERSE